MKFKNKKKCPFKSSPYDDGWCDEECMFFDDENPKFIGCTIKQNLKYISINIRKIAEKNDRA